MASLEGWSSTTELHPLRAWDALRLTGSVLWRCRNWFRWSRQKSGGRRRIRTSEGIANRFTVCPLWPLGNPPIEAEFLSSRPLSDGMLRVELATGLEPVTTGLQNQCSTIELRQLRAVVRPAFAGSHANTGLRAGRQENRSILDIFGTVKKVSFLIEGRRFVTAQAVGGAGRACVCENSRGSI